MGLVLILVIILVVGYLVKVNTKPATKIINRRMKYAYSNRVRLIFSGYLAILIIAMIVSTVLPVKGMTELKKVSSDELNQEGMGLYDAAKAGDIAKFDSKFLYENWTFNFQGQQLRIKSNEDTFYNITVMVERKKQNDGRIEAGFYMTGSEVNDLDISKFVQPPKLDLVDEHLLLTNSPKNKLRLSQFDNVFTVKQFTGQSTFGTGSHSSEGQSILYLKIPKDLKLNDTSGLNLEYVDGA
ncbi:hypothetical protein [Neobacillus kokaensis]|uniref:Uncharacterized protein n=1 Tax=Neobacillus kokaensis TaxID=2759023 RepID=A0ABQ3N3T7_9BACI|nr:hypothetical protein [Neobacillus kokaensis]GHH99605.1 hypothetical protein AM1BK_31480 [Neobacillus kokaensis]